MWIILIESELFRTYIFNYVHSRPIMNPRTVEEIIRTALLKCLPASHSDGPPSAKALFNSSEARAIKQEIIKVGKKLWMREYVDGNGGNISFRISRDYVLCTPTMCSKADLTLAH